MTILFLDFDGVLHPSEVYVYHGKGIVLKAGPEHHLFEHAELLGTLLEPFPEVHIVLSTSWCSTLRKFDIVKEYLPQALRKRVIGATWHSAKEHYRWLSLTRYEQIHEYVSRHYVDNWLAIDDDGDSWPDSKRHTLFTLIHGKVWASWSLSRSCRPHSCVFASLEGKVNQNRCVFFMVHVGNAFFGSWFR